MTECCRYHLVHGTKFPLLERDEDIVYGVKKPDVIEKYDLELEANLALVLVVHLVGHLLAP